MIQATTTIPAQGLFSRGMKALLIAQFVSALADNALLFAAIALMRKQLYPEWTIPLLQEFFVIAFILFAPFVGTIADAFPKGRVMLYSNAIRFVGAVAMLFGVPPLICYGIVGLGAAAYSPAKFGILRQLVDEKRLIKANSLIEGSTIVAILLGAVLGGQLADLSITWALVFVVACYACAMLINFFIPRLPTVHPLERFDPAVLIKDFIAGVKVLFRLPDARFSLLGTSLFWGGGATLRFMLVAWVPVALGIVDNSTAANLSGVVAIGIALGAALAARFITLAKVNRVLMFGAICGVLVFALSQANSFYPSVALLIGVGLCGGLFVIPLNALLQEKGHETVGAGHAIAVQNFCENIAMLLMLGAYIVLLRIGLSVPTAGAAVGGILFAGMMLIGASRLWGGLRPGRA